MPAPSVPEPAGANQFPNTEWTVVLTAGSNTATAGAALEILCRKYWPPLFSFALRHGLGREAAQDAVQGFILTIIERSSLSGVAPEGARFRSWLLGGFTHHLANLRRIDNATKRGGGILPLRLDSIADYERLLPASEDLSPAEVYDRGWASLTMTSAMARLRKEQEQAGKEALYSLLEPVVTAQKQQSHAELARQTSLSESNVAVTIHRLRARLRDILRAEVAQTVASSDSLEDELRYLMQVLQS